MDSFTVVEFTLHVLVRLPLNHLLNMIDTLQIIVMFSLLDVQLTANAGIFFHQMMQIASFDFFDTAPLLNALLALEENGNTINSNFKTLGYESIYVLHNLGTQLFLYVLYPFAILFTWLCSKFKYSRTVSEWGTEQKKRLLYGFFISILTQSYSVLAVSCCINLKFLTWSSFGEVV